MRFTIDVRVMPTDSNGNCIWDDKATREMDITVPDGVVSDAISFLNEVVRHQIEECVDEIQRNSQEVQDAAEEILVEE